MPHQERQTMRAELEFVYGPKQGAACYEHLVNRLDGFRARHRPATPGAFVDERDTILITYGDMVTHPGAAPLATLHEFLSAVVKDVISTVHVLPFFPYSSDDGFSVLDYRTVNPALGTWEDIERLSESFRLMVDAVVNHVSARSEWFQGFLRGEEPYRDYFITGDPHSSLSAVVRPRTSPLLTPVETSQGTKYVWTTFSADQVDLNFANPDVLLEIVDVLLEYIAHGARVIRLDAIAYLWKEIGTPCIHLPQTHALVRLFRAVVDDVAPGVLIVTETNVPHEENIAYLGDGMNEAHMVYQFPLPPLVAHAILTGSARKLSAWAAGLETPSDRTAFLNFTASHDGVGVRPVVGMLSEGELEALIEQTRAHGGAVSYRTDLDSSTSPYELNIVYYDLLNPPHSDESQALQVRRFLVSQAIMLALAGVPGIYFHSLFGSRNNYAGVKETGQARAINREKLRLVPLMADLGEPGSRRRVVFYRYRHLIRKRIGERAFHPNGPQRVLVVDDGVFGLLRTAPTGNSAIVALHNVTNSLRTLSLDLAPLGLHGIRSFTDIITERPYAAEAPGRLVIHIEPYQALWLRPEGGTR